MTIRVRFRREAEADVLDALAWYRERGLELGEEFLRSLDACLATIQRLPESHPVVFRDIRRALLSRFPYGVFYVRSRYDHRIGLLSREEKSDDLERASKGIVLNHPPTHHVRPLSLVSRR